MKSIYLSEFVDKIGGKIVCGKKDVLIENVAVKPSQISENTLFFDLKKRPLKREALNKHQNLTIVTTSYNKFKNISENITVIEVGNIKEAYWKFIRYYRNLFHIPVIGVTGTCGKTTTKEMIKHILLNDYKVQATYLSKNGSFRSLGYLMELADDTDVAVFEIPSSKPGAIRKSCQYFSPNIAIITTIGVDHLEGCNTFDEYVQTKAEIAEGLDSTGILILNGDNEYVNKIDLSAFMGKVVYFGLNERVHYRATNIKYAQGKIKFNIQHNQKSYSVVVPGHGEHNVYNALAAIAAVHAVGMDITEASRRLASFCHIDRHLQLKQGLKGCTVIDDTWSSNPTSVEAALKVLKNLSNRKKTIAVIGEIAMLGKYASEYYEAIGEKIVEMGTDILVTLGSEVAIVGNKAIQLGMKSDNVFHCKSSDEACKVLHDLLDTNCIVLVKTSMKFSSEGLIDKLVLKEGI